MLQYALCGLLMLTFLSAEEAKTLSDIPKYVGDLSEMDIAVRSKKLENTDPYEQYKAIDLLEHYHGPALKSFCLHKLLPHTNWHMQSRALRILGRYYNDPEVAAAYKALRQKNKHQLTNAMLPFHARQVGMSVLNELTDMRTNADHKKRSAAALALGSLPFTKDNKKEILDAITLFLNDPHPEVTQTIFTGLSLHATMNTLWIAYKNSYLLKTPNPQKQRRAE